MTSDPRRPRGALCVATVLLFTILAVPSAPAETDNHELVLPNFFEWDRTHLDILIVPPAHGPLASIHEGALPYGADGATPWGTYLEATLDVIEDWFYARDRFVQENPQYAWLAAITREVRVVTVDQVTPQDLLDADIIKGYPSTLGPGAGVAVHDSYTVSSWTPASSACWAMSSNLFYYGSPSYADMYKLAGHELGHCFGVSHTENDGQGRDIMSQGGYPQSDLRCPSNLNLLGWTSSFARASGESGGGRSVRIDHDDHERYCPPGR